MGNTADGEMARSEAEPSWTPPPRPEWLQQANQEGASMDLAAVVPLDAEELIATAARREELSDFGEDYWREPFAVLVKSLNASADLNLFGRLVVRDQLLNALRSRLQIEATYARHPEIDDEVVNAPVMVTGLPRSGTSILFEILAQDSRFGALLSWEVEFPCPPPEAATYRSDPRIERAQERLTRLNRLTPSFKSMHELGARIPCECGAAFYYSFMTEGIATYGDVPDYVAYQSRKADWRATYRYHCRLLKLLQWKNPRSHWLLKSPPHMFHLEDLFSVFPDAKVVYAHRDPLRATASSTSLIGTLRWSRSDKPFDPASFAQFLRPEVTAAGLGRIIDQIESGRVPRSQIFNLQYADLMRQPLEAIRVLYRQMGVALDGDTEQGIRNFLDNKPKGKFGAHQYEASNDAAARAHFARYQAYFGVENEA